MEHHPVLAEGDGPPVAIGRDAPDGEERHDESRTGAKHDSCRFDTCRCPTWVRLSTTHTDKTKAPRNPGRSQTSIVRLSRGDLGRPALTDDLLGGRYGNRPGLHRLWDHPQEVDFPVLQLATRLISAAS